MYKRQEFEIIYQRAVGRGEVLCTAGLQFK